MQDKKIPWTPILSTVFSGIGLKLVDWGIELLNKNVVIAGTTIHRNMIMIIVSILIIIICILVNYYYFKQIYYNKIIELREEYESSINEIQSNSMEIEKLLALTQYANRKYEELDEFYKKLSSVIRVDGKITDSLITIYMDKLERIIADNTSVDSGRINISIFEKKKNTRNTFVIKLSNYHTEGTIKTLELDKKSFVASVFKSRKMGYIQDISNRRNGVPFAEREGRDFETICGVPYVVDDKCMAVIIITMREPDALDDIVNSYKKLVERYVQVIGFLFMFSYK